MRKRKLYIGKIYIILYNIGTKDINMVGAAL